MIEEADGSAEGTAAVWDRVTPNPDAIHHAAPRETPRAGPHIFPPAHVASNVGVNVRGTREKGVLLSSANPIDAPAALPAEAGPGAPPAWISGSDLLAAAYALAAGAHGDQRRATDQEPFLDHVVEVGRLLHDAGFDDEIVAAGLLHDAVERGTLSETRLRSEVDEEISALVLALTEDAAIDSFAKRKEALREQVQAAGSEAITIFAADKLSDIRGLRRGIDGDSDSIEARMGTTVGGMAGHYSESVAMIEASEPDSAFVHALHAELDALADAAPAARAA